METSIADCEAGKLSSVSIRVLTAGDRSLDQPVLEKLFVEVASVTAQVSNQVADLRTDSGILVADQTNQLSVDIGIVDWLIKLFRDPC